MKVIILTPTYKSSKILPYYFNSVRTLNPQPNRYVFLENNTRDKYKTIRTLWKLAKTLPVPYEIHRLWFHADINKANPYTAIAIVRQILLERARRIDPDYAIFLDDDIFVKSPDMITALTLWNEDIVGGSYLRAFPEGIYLASKWKSPRGDKVHRLHFFVKKPLDEPLMTSAGCLCLSRRIIQDKRVNFWPMPIDEHPNASEDFGYCYQARKYGYKITLDGTVRLSHALIVKSRFEKPWTYDDEKGKYIDFNY